MDDALAKALKSADGPTALGRAIGVTSQAISQWRRVPVERVLAVEAATGIPRHELRPDIYPPPSMPAPQAASNSNLTEALP
jgi:DNA-binding transcriptional regulator YdaS (Cro superfamily)